LIKIILVLTQVVINSEYNEKLYNVILIMLEKLTHSAEICTYLRTIQAFKTIYDHL